jgi:hypothetical protein
MFKIETMVFTNPTEHTVRLDALGFDSVGPGQDVELPLTLCAPYRTDNGQRGKSAVEGVAPQLRPKSEEDYKAWLDVPPPPVPVSKIVSVAARAPSEPPGVKALREKAEALKAKASASPQAKVSASAGKA